jgi:tetratricopeptide (TPR) repeat protein
MLLNLMAVAIALAQQPTPSGNDAEPLASLGDLAKLSTPRDEAARDRIAATAYLAHGRMLQQRKDFPAALRRYQRAYRYDDAGRGLKEVVFLAMETGRLDQAARYAALGGRQITDLIVLRRLAIEATNRQDWQTAARLYELSLAPAGAQAAKSATQVLMRAEQGRLLFLSDEYERSAAAFADVRAALAKPQDYDLSEAIQKVIIGDRRQTYSLMARAALEAKRYDDALALFRETYKDLPDSDEAQLDEATVYQRRGEMDEAISRCTKVLEKGGRESGAAFQLLRRALAKTTPEDKLEQVLAERLASVQAAHPQNEELRRQLAQCRIRQSKLDEATMLLSDPAIEKPSDELKLLLAEVQRLQKSPDKWLATLAGVAASGSLSAIEEEARRAASDETFSAAILQMAQGAKADSAEEKSAQGVAAVVALERKQYDDAEKLLQASLPDEPAVKGRLLTLWGLRLMQVEQYARALPILKRVIDEKLDGGDPAPVWYYLSAAASFAGQHEVALDAAAHGREGRPNDLRFLQREAWVAQQAGRREQARQRYEELFKRFDKATDAKTRNELLQVRRALSAVCHELGDDTAAVERLEEVLDEFPSDIGASNDLGYLWADRGLHLQRSLRLVQRAVAAEPENTAFRDSLGWVYFRLGRFADAVAELEKAAGGDNPGGVILDHLGDALAKADRAEDARAAWQRAAEAFHKEGNEPGAAVVEKKLRMNDQ